MKIIENKIIIADDNNNYSAHFLRVDPEDLSNTLYEIVQDLTNLSWLNDFRFSVTKSSFESRAKKTCEELKVKLLKETELSDMLSNAGEYIVSCLSKKALVCGLEHTDIPLMELLGRKTTGNPGFDFYTEKNNILVAGESKYVKSKNAYNDSLSQINEFIKNNKHIDDIGLLFFVASEKSVENLNNNIFEICAGFSSTNINTDNLIQNIKNNKEFKKALEYANIYLVAVNMYE